MKAACSLVSHSTTQFLLDQKKKILKTSVEQLIGPGALTIYPDQGVKDGAGIGGLQQSPFGQHYAMCQIDGVKRG